MDQSRHVRFQELVWDYYAHHGRDLPWRHPNSDGTFGVYPILVSEMMLQQTQVSRVIPKYRDFMAHFPDAATLDRASLIDVLRLWSGLGYNRRAKYLWQAAGMLQVSEDMSVNTLVKLPGVGKNTAGAIAAYAYNQPTVFIETNIRTVYIAHYFPDDLVVTDTDLLPIIEATVDQEHPREWYWALMDYGTHIKASVGNAARRSSTYTKQSTFAGSRRQLRGRILKALTESEMPMQALAKAMNDERTYDVVDDLVADDMVMIRGQQVMIRC